jgi:integrase
MASLHRRPRSKYWHASWRDAAGTQHSRTTKETNRQKAWVIALGWEHAERTAITEANARKVLSEILQRNTGHGLRMPTVRNWFTEWLKTKGDETKARYTGISNSFLLHLGKRADQPLAGIAPVDVQSYVNKQKDAKHSDKTVSLHLQALKSAFSLARKMQLIDNSPADPVTFAVEEEIQKELFTDAEARLLIDAAEGEWKTLLMIGYYTGLRLVAAAMLRRENVDLTRRTISVAKPGKKGRRVVIPIHESLFDYLKSERKAHDDYLMPTLASADSGGKRGLSAAFIGIALKAGVDLREVVRKNGKNFRKRTFHSLRHGFVSGLANEGVSPEHRRAITGHKTESIHARYTHLEIEKLRESVNKLRTIPENPN